MYEANFHVEILRVKFIYILKSNKNATLDLGNIHTLLPFKIDLHVCASALA